MSQAKNNEMWKVMIFLTGLQGKPKNILSSSRKSPQDRWETPPGNIRLDYFFSFVFSISKQSVMHWK